MRESPKNLDVLAEPEVYQVRAIDVNGNPRIVHAYKTATEAKNAINLMTSKTGKRYIFVKVPNQPNQYWSVR